MAGPGLELCFIISPAAPRILRLATRAGKTGGLACFDPAKENHYVKQTNKVNKTLWHVSRVTGIPGWYWIRGIKCSDTTRVGLVY